MFSFHPTVSNEVTIVIFHCGLCSPDLRLSGGGGGAGKKQSMGHFFRKGHFSGQPRWVLSASPALLPWGSSDTWRLGLAPADKLNRSAQLKRLLEWIRNSAS